ncbi:glycosyltransferase family 4 protein [Pseudarthrobacter sp. PvP090]|uniref:glycosyltransferase family 4 protein n=1 Tax=Pseudarthrobacter sp. PvP090 TaxID=3156393 RepID=UPI00339AC9C5
MKVFMLTEMPPELAPPGVRRRYEHFSDWLAGHGIDWSHEAILTPDEASSSKITRVKIVLKKLHHLDRTLPREAVVLVLGLGAVHMLFLAVYLRFASGLRRRVAYDTCDSWLLQVKARLRTGGLPLALPAVAGLVLQTLLGRSLFVSYISVRDQQADRWVNFHRSAFVVSPVAPRELQDAESLGAVIGRIKRVSVSADYEAFHNHEGMKFLRDAWESPNLERGDLELHLYGKGEPIRIADSIFVGWADDISEIYQGNTAVYIPNMHGSGVPNKLIDAISARRPVIVHRSVSGGFENNSLVFVFDNEAQLLANLRRLVDLDFVDEGTASSKAVSEIPLWMAKN